jgi:DNA repair protein RadC
VRVAELPEEQRPREKLLARGAAALTDAELLAVLLRTGLPGTSVLDLAREWLHDVGGLEALMALDAVQLSRRPGVKGSKATLLAAALELGRRLARARLEGQPLLDRPQEVATYVARYYAAERVEIFGCLTLDVRNRLLRCHVLHRGARAYANVEPAEVFHAAIRDNAHGLILWHTHPSGDPSPSDDDLSLTKRLSDAGNSLAIPVLDHVVVGREGFVSLRQRGTLGSS